VAHWLNQRLGLTGEAAMDKRHPAVMKIHKAIAREYEAGRSTNMSNRELEHLARHCLPRSFVSQFDRLKARARELAQDLILDMIDNPAIRSMDPSRQEPFMEKWVTEIPFIQFMYITDQSGVKTTRNVVSLHEKAKFTGATTYGVGANLSDRVWFQAPLGDGKIHVTDFYTSRFTGALCITVSGPVRNDEDEIVGVLGLDIRFEDLANMEAEELHLADDDDD
jgi:hypothetical protein